MQNGAGECCFREYSNRNKSKYKRGLCENNCRVAHFYIACVAFANSNNLGQTNGQSSFSESFIIFPRSPKFARVPKGVLHRWLLRTLFSIFTLYSATWRIKRLRLLHPCVCPVLENNTTPNFLVRPASYRGGKGSPAILRPHHLAVPCWSQWDMPGRRGTGVKCPVEVC